MPVANQTTAFVNEQFPISGLLGTNLYDVDLEPRVRPGTTAMATGNRGAVYVRAHAAIAANGAVALAAGALASAAGTGYKALAAIPISYYGWLISDAGVV